MTQFLATSSKFAVERRELDWEVKIDSSTLAEAVSKTADEFGLIVGQERS